MTSAALGHSAAWILGFQGSPALQSPSPQPPRLLEAPDLLPRSILSSFSPSNRPPLPRLKRQTTARLDKTSRFRGFLTSCATNVERQEPARSRMRRKPERTDPARRSKVNATARQHMADGRFRVHASRSCLCLEIIPRQPARGRSSRRWARDRPWIASSGRCRTGVRPRYPRAWRSRSR